MSDSDSETTTVDADAQWGNPSHSPAPIATNTLILARLPPDLFLNSADHLRELVQRLGGGGTIVAFAPLASFGRCLVVYEATDQAMRARIMLERDKMFSGKVYYGEHTSPESLEGDSLQVPENERNWLISPPGSPPIGWVQTREAGPNYRVLSDDFVQRFAELDLDTLDLGDGHNDDFDMGTGTSPNFASTTTTSAAGLTHLTSDPARPIPSSSASASVSASSNSLTPPPPSVPLPLVIRVEDWTNSVRPKAVSDIELASQEQGNIALQRRLEVDNRRWQEQHGADFEAGSSGADAGNLPRAHSSVHVSGHDEQTAGRAAQDDFASEEDFRAEMIRRMKRMPPKTRMPPVGRSAV
ncbi:Calcipressin-domain-containing protein [Gonapodya prolifera JEL478]|uniref:Calcipressin-domain-containing protein n=1 Tax=Gonapodya prolifera (strain JEL478) TaxID=1344416 RepID=A0A139A526_GONPJ|nr:Calcipressin-domain-containing protein [Gonapodya prolifera JEL478]|eukprot:KXS11906.1 Calcipressin-domain-containing protein [Gonapodya prolifera JEL478]